MINRALTAFAMASIGALALGAQTPAVSFKVAKYSVGGDGGTDYIVAEPGTGRVFVSRGTHVMIVDGPTGKVIGDIPDTPRVHGIGLVKKWNHGFTTNGGDSTVTMFDLKTLAVLKRIPVPAGGLDGIMYDASSDRIILTNHSNPVGTATAIDAKSGEITGTAELEDNAPEGAASDGKGRLFVNNERKNTIQVIDQKTMKAVASWPLEPCKGPTGIAYDSKTRRIFAGCSGTSVVVDADSGKVVANIANGNGVDALGWDPAQKLIYIPAREGNVTVVHQDSADQYTTVATVQTMVGAKTIAVDPTKHVAYALAVEYGPAPTPAAGAAAPPPGGGRGPTGPVIGAQLFAISH